MVNYSQGFWYQAVEKALSQGIKPTARELSVSRNALRHWIKVYKKAGLESFIKNQHSHKRTPLDLEKLVVYQKEKNPAVTLKDIQEVIKQKTGKVLSVNGIHNILGRFGMTNRCYLPFKGYSNRKVQSDLGLARILLKKGNLEKAAVVLNSLPSLSDFSILEKIPAKFLSLRRQAEQLEVLWGTMPMEEMCEKAKELRKKCENEKLFFTGFFVTTMEINALNFLGVSAKVLSLYKKYSKYLLGLPSPLKYIFLIECFISFMREPEKYPEGIFRNFSYNLEKFVSTLPEGNHRAQWYVAISACFQMVGNINQSLKWMEKLYQELPASYKKEYLPEYLSLLAEKGEYSEILGLKESFGDISVPLFLRIFLAQANALLGTGKPNEALKVALNAFYRAEKEHLRPAIVGFMFFIACCYNAMKETKKVKQYLKMSIRFLKKTERTHKLISLLLGHIPPVSHSIKRNARFRLANLYLLSYKTLRKKNYLKAYRFTEKKGLFGFLHRIILLHPEVVIKLLRKGKETYLPQEFLNLPIFKEELPMHKLFLLTDKESVFYGNRKINISPRSKDFHLLVYLFLNRQKYLNKETLFDIFYKKTKNPVKSLTKALSRIRRILNLSKGALSSKRGRVLFNNEAKIDLEEFEQSFKMGKILEKVGEVERALREYRACFALYKKGPFKQMGYYYNFAEERRTIVRNMFNRLCNALITNAKNKERSKTVRRIEEKFKKEGLVFDKEI
jgi:transposase